MLLNIHYQCLSMVYSLATLEYTHIGIQFCNKSVISCIAKLWLKGCFYVIKMHNKKAKSEERQSPVLLISEPTHSWTNTSNTNNFVHAMQLA